MGLLGLRLPALGGAFGLYAAPNTRGVSDRCNRGFHFNCHDSTCSCTCHPPYRPR